MFYKRADLIYNDYRWTAYPSDNPKVTGKPDSTRFNRREGYEVLYLINALMKEWGYVSTSSGEKIERMIKINLPSTMIMQAEVKEWIRANWSRY